MLHTEILSAPQQALFPLIREFRPIFGLVGGTALALHIGHRESIDFDLFTTAPLHHTQLRKQMVALGKHIQTLVESKEEYTVLVEGVKVTFLQYLFPFTCSVTLADVALLPDILTLAAMKAYALGRRAKWKDYVDLYFVMQTHHPLSEISEQAKLMFGTEFSEKNFRTQLAYFQDLDYSETVRFRPGFETSDEVIQQALVNWSLTES